METGNCTECETNTLVLKVYNDDYWMNAETQFDDSELSKLCINCILKTDELVKVNEFLEFLNQKGYKLTYN